MSKQLFLLLPCVWLTSYAQTPPDYSQEAFVAEQDSTEIAYETDGTGVRKSSARIRIQSGSGIQRYAVLTFPYQGSAETLDIDYVRVRKVDATTVATPPENTQDIASEITRQAPLYSDLREKHVAVRGLAVGDVLEYQVQWHTTKALAPGQFWFAYNFSTEAIVLRQSLQVTVPRDRLVKWLSPKFKPAVTEAGDRRVFMWSAAQLEHKSKEQEKKDQQTTAYLAARGKAPQADIQISSFRSWEEVGRWYDSLQLERIKPTPEIRAKAGELTKGLDDKLAKAHAIYNYVSTQIHYIGIDFGIGRYQPHAAAEVLANQFGDCKDKHTLLAALLESAGIESYAALIGSSHDLDPELPSPAQFDHVISAVPLGDRLIWLDTTAQVSPFGYLSSTLRGKQALLMAPDKPPVLAATPADPAQLPHHTFRIDAKLNDTGTLEGKVEQTLQGDDAEVLFRAAFRSVPLPQWKDLVQQVSYQTGFAGDVSDVNVTSPEKTDEPFRLSYSYLRKDYPDWTNRRVSSPLPPMALPAGPDADTKPPNPIWLGSPMDIRFESQVELPKGYRPSFPRNLDLVESFAEFHRSYAFKDGRLTTERHLVVKVSEVPDAALAAYKKFAKAVEDEYGRSVLVSTGAASLFSYQEQIWELPYSENAEAARLYDEARDKFNKQDQPGEIASLKRALEIDPKFMRAQLWLGEIYKSSGHLDDAAEAYRKAIAIDPQQPVSYKALGFTLLAMKKLDESVAVWQQFTKVDPGDAAGPSELSASLMALKRYTEAESAAESAIEIEPDSAVLQLGLAQACVYAGHYAKASGAYRKGLEMAPQPMMFNNAAYALADANAELPSALEWAKKAVTDEAAASQQVNLSQLRIEDLAHPVALAMFWDTLGWAYFKSGDLDQAEKYMSASWALAQHAVVADHLGQLYERQDKKQSAIRMYKLALSHLSSQTGAPKQKDETMARLKRLSPAAAKEDFNNLEISSELSAPGLTKFPRPLGETGSAEFFVVFAADPKTASVTVADAKFISGSESLKPAANALKSATSRSSCQRSDSRGSCAAECWFAPRFRAVRLRCFVPKIFMT